MPDLESLTQLLIHINKFLGIRWVLKACAPEMQSPSASGAGEVPKIMLHFIRVLCVCLNTGSCNVLFPLIMNTFKHRTNSVDELDISVGSILSRASLNPPTLYHD